MHAFILRILFDNFLFLPQINLKDVGIMQDLTLYFTNNIGHNIWWINLYVVGLFSVSRNKTLKLL